MMSEVEQYKNKMKDFFAKYSKEVWEWVGNECKANFYEDGVVNPEVWFEENNKFRPLFVLKEVHEASIPDENTNKEAQRFGFLDENNKDPLIHDGMWKRMRILAEAMYKVYTDNKKEEYEILEKSMKETNHKTACERVAIINLKKLAGGRSVDSSKSRNSLCFSCHAVRFKDKLLEQIGIIKPTIIICCGKDIVSTCLVGTDKMLKVNGKSVPVINTYHPAMRGNFVESFYNHTLSEFIKRKSNMEKVKYD